jgi:hypothetical protein
VIESFLLQFYETIKEGDESIGDFLLWEVIYSERASSLFDLHLQIGLLFWVEDSFIKRYSSHQKWTIDVCILLERLIEIAVCVYYARFSILEEDLIWFEFD